jgi:hypothetical protein
MVIDLEEFMKMCNITKFRKVLNLIRCGSTPDEEAKILNHIEQFNEDYEATQKVLANKVVGYTDKIKITEREIEGLTARRSRFRRNSEMWKKYSEGVKLQREELKLLKKDKSSADREFKQNVRLKGFYEKCIEVMQG